MIFRKYIGFVETFLISISKSLGHVSTEDSLLQEPEQACQQTFVLLVCDPEKTQH